MDAVRFDALTRSLFARTSRRVSLGAVAAALLGALGLPLDEIGVLAKKKHKGKGKKKKRKKKHKKKNQRPDCPPPLSPEKCDGQCTNYLIDDDNCGGCATAASPSAATCIPGRATCVDGICIAGDTDALNCQGVNGAPGCPRGSVCCKDPIGQGTPQAYEFHCRALKSNPSHCGACHHACTEGKDPACCFGLCTDLHADPLNCGACLNRCPQTMPLCYAKECRGACPQGLSTCGDTCFHQPTETCCDGTVIATVDLPFDYQNCGACGRDCTVRPFATGECCGGECCDINESECCSGQCTNIMLEENCGECGNECGPNEYCRLGTCT